MKLNYWLYGILALAVIGVVFISGCIPSGVTPSDFELSASWKNVGDIFYNENEKVFHSWFSLEVTSNKKGLWYRVYDKSTDQELTESGKYGTFGVRTKDNEWPKFVADAKPKTIDQLKGIVNNISNYYQVLEAKVKTRLLEAKNIIVSKIHTIAIRTLLINKF